MHCRMLCTLLVVIASCLVSTVVASVFHQEGPECFRKAPEECAPLDVSSSRCKNFGTDIYCCHIDSEYQLINGLKAAVKPSQKITALHIRNMTLVRLEVNIPEWRNLVSLSITDGNISQIIGTLESSHLSCLNLSNNYIEETDPLLISKLSTLVRLDISNNNISLTPSLSPSLVKFEIDLSNNPYINCHNVLDMLDQISRGPSWDQLHFDNRPQTVCRLCTAHTKCGPYTRVNMLYVDNVEYMNKRKREKPSGLGWECKVEFRVLSAEKIFVLVDCSNLNLDTLPRYLPKDTHALNVSFNNISSLEPVVNEPSYRSLLKLYADQNVIMSIDVLEGSTFISKFEELSLRYNKISIIPTYILNNAFAKTSMVRKQLSLGFNYIQCDCNTVQVLKNWLIAHTHDISDPNDLLCRNYHSSVMRLEPAVICVTPREWTDYIYYIIAGEVAALLLLLGKVSYDYWVFRTEGYLPWPASKMPKMPCDWVFES
uniref:Protein halfway n=2 Tax=Cacopsylla melanoneura TaxID=428564 RepID=A0A8D8LDP6_9HEMI